MRKVGKLGQSLREFVGQESVFGRVARGIYFEEHRGAKRQFAGDPIDGGPDAIFGAQLFSQFESPSTHTPVAQDGGQGAAA